MVYDKANELAADIKASEEYKRFKLAKERIEEGSTTESLLKEYRKLQLRAQAAMVAGEEDAECLEKLQKLGEILQMDKAASEYLISEFMLSRMLGDIYKILADAVDVDLGMLES
ncbi:MAG: YlbF family regulator [Clostridiales bacterium]|nr:YlbF family regulator [Clostridiales bacterium]